MAAAEDRSSPGFFEGETAALSFKVEGDVARREGGVYRMSDQRVERQMSVCVCVCVCRAAWR